jgi:hypothetical protein
MLRMGMKIYILLDSAAGIVFCFLAIFVVIVFCLNYDLPYHPFVIVGAVIAGVFCIGALLDAVREFFNVMKE